MTASDPSETTPIPIGHAVEDTDDDPLEGEVQLVVLSGRDVGRRHVVGDEATLGRDRHTDIVIADRGVSRSHARIERTSSGAYVIRDLGSRNGTTVNGILQEEATLRLGDRIGLGKRTLLLVTQRDRFEQQLVHTQSLQALGELAGGVAHDFNNLLGVVLTNVTFLRETPGVSPDELSECLEEMEIAARRASDLSRQLLAFAHGGIGAGKGTTSVMALAEEATQLARRTLPRSIHIETAVETDMTLVGGQGQFLQVLMNLCINAGDAMPGGGTLSLSAEPLVLEESAPLTQHLPAGKYVVLTVADTGVGMDEEHRLRAFEPFFTTKPAGKGTGLGLTTVYKIVQQHAGHIEIESDPGAGTRFRIFLPATDAAGEISRSSEGEALDRIPAATTVLVADDEPLVRRTARRVLEGDGIEVVAAADGNEALRAYAELGARIKLAVLDLDMPNLDGEGTHKILKSMNPELKFLVCSGYLDDERERELAEAGVHGFLRKPYDAEGLRAAVREVLADLGTTMT